MEVVSSGRGNISRAHDVVDMKSHVLTPTLLGERKHAEGSDGVEDCAHAALVDNITCRVDVIH